MQNDDVFQYFIWRWCHPEYGILSSEDTWALDIFKMMNSGVFEIVDEMLADFEQYCLRLVLWQQSSEIIQAKTTSLV